MNTHMFIKVEDYFGNCNNWNTLTKIDNYNYNKEQYILDVSFVGTTLCCQMQFIRKDSIRVRIGKSNKNFTNKNTRYVVMNTIDDLTRSVNENSVINIEHTDDGSIITLTTEYMSVAVSKDTFGIRVTKRDTLGKYEEEIWSTGNPAVYYTGGYDDEMCIIQKVNKSNTAEYVGFGEHGGISLFKNATQMVCFNYDNMMYNQVYNNTSLAEREPLYHTDPFFVEVNRNPNTNVMCSTFIDNYSQISFDIGCTFTNAYMFGTRFGNLDYYVSCGDNFEALINNFTSTVGKSRLKPRYALGYHQGCYGYETRNDIEDVVNKYRENNIPIDGIHIDVDIQDKYKTFTIDNEKFPNPHEMFNILKAKGIKCSTNITPIISKLDDKNYQTLKEGLEKNYFVSDIRKDANSNDGRKSYYYEGGNLIESDSICNDYNTGRPYVGQVNYGGGNTMEGHYPDLNRKDVRYWWGEQYKFIFETGIEMVWQDMTTPCIDGKYGDMKGFPSRLMITDDSLSDSDQINLTPIIKIWNLYSYNLHKATYHGLNNLECRKGLRNFIIGRGSFTGMHRFAGLWTGDNSSSWNHFQMSISQILAQGICGICICGADVGGFMPSYDGEGWAAPDLIIRWTAAGAFLPWFRNHYIRKDKKKFQEPYAYKDVDLSTIEQSWHYIYQSVLPICKYFISLRYTLMQLLYDCMFENMLNGLPICRAMIINDPYDKTLYSSNKRFMSDQFFIRKDFLVAPIMKAEFDCNGKRDVYLPTGHRWYSFMNNKNPLSLAIDGGTIIDYDAHISSDEDHINFIVPIYIREGAIIPFIELEQYVGEKRENPISIVIYPTKTDRMHEYVMYLDDGVSRSSAPKLPQYKDDSEALGMYREIRISQKYDNNVKTITIQRTYNEYDPNNIGTEYILVVLHDPSIPNKEYSPLDNKKCNIYTDGQRFEYNERYDSFRHLSEIKVPNNCENVTVTLEYLT